MHLQVSPLRHKDRQLLIEKVLPVIQRLGMPLGAFDQDMIQFGRSPYVHDDSLLGQQSQRFGILEFANTAPRVIDEMLVAVDGIHLADKLGNVTHGANFGLPVQRLTTLEFRETEPSLPRISQFTQESRHRREIIYRDVAANVDRIRLQQIAQEWNLHRLQLDVVGDRFIQIARTDSIVPRIVKPGFPGQLVGQGGFPHPGHTQQGDAFGFPFPEFRGRHFHRLNSVACSMRVLNPDG